MLPPQRPQDQALDRKLRSIRQGEALIPGIEEDADKLLSRGIVVEPELYYIRRDMKGLPGECHLNSSRLWAANKDEHDLSIYTGYAYKNRKWYPHSWVMHNETEELFETTPNKFSCYFGFPLTDEEAKAFWIEQEF